MSVAGGSSDSGDVLSVGVGLDGCVCARLPALMEDVGMERKVLLDSMYSIIQQRQYELCASGVEMQYLSEVNEQSQQTILMLSKQLNQQQQQNKAQMEEIDRLNKIIQELQTRLAAATSTSNPSHPSPQSPVHPLSSPLHAPSFHADERGQMMASPNLSSPGAR